MTNRLKKLTFFMIVSTFIGVSVLISCTKENEILENEHNSFQIKTKEAENENIIIEQYSALVAKSLINPEFRERLKKAALERFDGDYDVLAINLRPDSLQEFSTMAKIMEETYNENFKDKYKSTYKEFLANTFTVIPNLQISIPVNCKDWDTYSYLPYVLPLYVDIEDEGHGVMLEAFNGLDKRTIFDMGKKPNIPVVVVSISERVDSRLKFKELIKYNYTPMDSTPASPGSLSIDRIYGGELQLHWADVSGELGYRILKKAGPGEFTEIATTNANQNYYTDIAAVPGEWNQYMICSFNENGNSSAMKYLGKYASYRDMDSELKLSTIGFNSEDALEDYESWARGCPELKLYVIGGNEGSNSSFVTYESSTPLEPDDKDDIIDKDGWAINETVIPNWNSNDNGSILTFFWIEEDGGRYSSTLEIDAKLEIKFDSLLGGMLSGDITLTHKAKVDLESKDDTIGRRDVYFWDPLRKEYSIREFYWILECVD